ncbi:MAG: prolipoprotein diacylglyceryl transferase [Bacteroidota bacterium]
MQSQADSYFHWSANPNLVDGLTIPMPFSFSILGIILGILFMYLGFTYWVKPQLQDQAAKSSRKSQGEPLKAPWWMNTAVVLGALLAGQLVALLFDPTLLDAIGPIQIRYYGPLFASAFIAGYLIEFKLFKDAHRTQEELEELLTTILIATVIGARLGHVLFYDPGYYLRNPSEIIAIWHGGLASHGAAIGILLAMYWFAKRKTGMTFLWLADRVVVAVAIGGAFIRTGNFFNSEIVGQVTDVPWAIVFERLDMLPRHPTMLYEALLSVLVFAALLLLYRAYKNSPPEGAMFGTFLVMLFGGRFLLEYTKIPQAGFAADWPINMGQILSIPLIAAGLWLLFSYVNWKQKQQDAA